MNKAYLQSYNKYGMTKHRPKTRDNENDRGLRLLRPQVYSPVGAEVQILELLSVLTRTLNSLNFHL